ncbi:MAG TPA: phosphatase [Clostridiales bacterium]|nr:phosphatase [Clostridiales bacterium]
MNVDFHIHSTNSDGSDIPEEIFKRARDKNIKFISITDHDTLHGIEENKILAKRYNIKYIPGLELSAFDYQNNRKCHIVGLYVEKGHDVLDNIIEKTSFLRHQTSVKQIIKLSELGYDINLKELIEKRKSKVIFKQHIMKSLIEKGYANNIYGDFYQKMFKNNGPLDMKIQYPDHIEAIKAIKKSGGLPILAHPSQYENLIDIKNMVNSGLAGIEWDYPSVSSEYKKIIASVGEKYKLLLSSGSDYHGSLV